MEPLGAEGTAEAAAVTLPPRPYPGLRAFAPEEWPIFFGRERTIDAVVARLVRQRVVFVHGDSGCGKSSLVRAGVFAQLLHCGATTPASWRTAISLPRRAPLWTVAEALARLHGQDGDDDRVVEWRRALNFGRAAPEALGELRERAGVSAPACLLIDQFEELFEHARREGPEEAHRLTDVLVGWHEHPPDGLYVAMTMRSEYLGHCARFGGFAEMVNETQYLLPRMDHEDMMRAIREPARLFDGQVSRELAERLIADAGGSQDQLPLIQHGLMRLYRQHVTEPGPWRLGVEHFPCSGGLAGILSARADEVTSRCRPQHGGGERVVEDLFRALTDITADGQAIRRPQTFGHLADVTGAGETALRPILDTFRAEDVSFLTPPSSRPLSTGDVVDIGHEALIRSWRVLGDPGDGWLVREFRNGLVWRSLLVQTDSFERDARNVLAPVTTDERVQWMKRRNPAWAARYGGGWERVQRLLEASVAARDRDRAEEADALRREARARAMQRSLVVLVSLVIALGGALWVAYREAAESRIQFQKAETVRERSEELYESWENLYARWSDQRRELEQQAGTLERLSRTLQQASEANAHEEWTATIGQAAQELDQQAGELSKVADQPPSRPSGSLSAIRPRLYVHIASEAQRVAADDFARALVAVPSGEDGIVVPGIELVKTHPSRAELRCFEPDECQDEAPHLLETVRSLLASPEVRLQDLSGRYSGTGIRRRHYELWFPPGEIVMRQP